jgi:hypothetical protein
VIAFLSLLASTDFESNESWTKLLVTNSELLDGANDFDVSVASFVFGKITPKLLLVSFALGFSVSWTYLGSFS